MPEVVRGELGFVAPLVPHERRTTSEGLEEAFAVNVLAPHLLGKWLRPALLAGAPARVVTFWGGGPAVLDLDDLQSEKAPFDGWNTYVQTKHGIAALTLAIPGRPLCRKK